jgi:hypothetical protein
VQVVDVLGDDGDAATALVSVLALEPRERNVRRVRFGALQPAAALVIEFVHELWVGTEALGRRHLAVIVLGPDAALVAECRKPGFRGETCAGEDDDVAKLWHRRAIAVPVAERNAGIAMKTLLSWSTGKDSAWSLHMLRQTPGIEVAGLFTTVNAAFDRVAMHAVRRAAGPERGL